MSPWWRRKKEDDRPEYLGASEIARMLGVSRTSAYAIMRHVGIVDLSAAGVRRMVVKRTELERFLEQRPS